MPPHAMAEKSGTFDSYTSMPPPPNQAKLQPSPYKFLPSFEAQINANLRNFGDTEANTGEHGFDATRRSDRDSKQRRRARRNLTIIAVVTLVSICALIAGVFVSKKSHRSNTASVETQSVSETVAQTVLFQRSTQTDGIVIVTATVTTFETVPVSNTLILTAMESSQTTEITPQQPTGVSTAATSNATPSQLASTSITVTASPQASIFPQMSFSYKPSTTSASLPTTTTQSSQTTSTIDAAAESSIQAALSSLSAALIAEPVPTTLSTSYTQQSTSTTMLSSESSPASSASEPTATNDLQGGMMGFCSVPGSSCN